MLLKNIFLKSIRDQCGSLLWWSIGMILVCAPFTFMYETMADSLGTMVEAYPPEIGKLFGIENIKDMASPEGWLTGELYGMMLPICFIIFSVLSGANAIAGEEEDRRIEILLSEPVSRRRLYIEKYLAFLFNILCLAIVVLISIAIPSFVISMGISLYGILSATLNMALLTLSLGVLTFTIAASTGNRRNGIVVSVAVAIISYITNVANQFFDWIEVVNRFSIFNYYETTQALSEGLDLKNTLGFIGLILIMTIVGYIRFQRRDLRI